MGIGTVSVSPPSPTTATPIFVSYSLVGCFSGGQFAIEGNQIVFERQLAGICGTPPLENGDLEVGFLAPGDYVAIVRVLEPLTVRQVAFEVSAAFTVIPAQVPVSTPEGVFILCAFIMAAAVRKMRLTTSCS